ncbi:hypothetical protein PACTADRAFT_75225 [Pachysolen tannophilus NRRL Y-2460]|uniref:Trafficking protein particle complex subunit 6B n=1 Tax=Pachysolen tannophilus NRRL Y-2460 TaxID=669874 RepID=A0A1E4TW76_PACTA|nr:hypothetical protein PACTADRAFT_75225 [Pachysolen tannophilus NRRL Y-2460]
MSNQLHQTVVETDVDNDFEKQINVSCLEYLLMELGPLALRITDKLEKYSSSSTRESNGSGNGNDNKQVDDFHYGGVELFQNESLVSNEINNQMLDNFGFQIGKILIEQLIFLKNDGISTKMDEILDIMKIIARDVWKMIYQKQIDNLRTNHRGTFVLIDNSHRLISSMYGPDKHRISGLYLNFSCGVIKGVLNQSAFKANVEADLKSDGSVHYTIVVI